MNPSQRIRSAQRHLLVLAGVTVVALSACSRGADPPSTTTTSLALPTTAATTTTTTPTEFTADLARLAPPSFNELAWKQARTADPLAGYGDPPPPAEVGDRESFVYSNGIITSDLTAELVYANEALTMWFADDVPYDVDEVIAAADRFVDEVLPVVTDLVGPLPPAGVDGDPRIAVVHLSELGDAVGEFASFDTLPAAEFPESNQREMLYIAGDIEMGSDLHLATITHELVHLIDFHVRGNAPLWMAEGVAQLAEYVAGFDTVVSHLRYLAYEPVPLNDWGPLQLDDRHYGAAFLAMVHMYEQHGAESIRDMLSSDFDGMAAIGDALFDQGVTLEEFVSEWMWAMATDHRFDTAYPGLDLPRACGLDHATGDWDRSYELNQFAPRYVSVTGSGAVDISLSGNSTIGPIDDEAAEGEWMWWAGPSDGAASTLTRSADLTGLTSGTLNFSAWFDTGFTDALLVLVSGDGGESWDVVSGDAATMVEIRGTFVEEGYTGWSGAAKTPVWIDETIDISAFAGGEVLVQFQYVSDLYESRVGVALDNIEIVELEDVEGGETAESAWTGAGFQRAREAVDQPWVVQVLQDGEAQPVDVAQGAASARIDLGDGGTAVLGFAAVAPGTGAAAEMTVSVVGDAIVGPPASGEVHTFDVPCTGWEMESTAEYVLAQEDGRLRLTALTEGVFTWSAHEDIHDIVTIDAGMTFGDVAGGAGGLMCRLSAAGFYEVNVADDGTYLMGMAAGDGYEVLVDWTASEAISQGPDAFNALRMECGDGYVAAFVNGVELATIENDVLPPGRTAVVAASFTSEIVDLWYDNVIIEGGVRDAGLYVDDTFDAPSSVWLPFVDSGSRNAVEEGEYLLEVFTPDWSAESYTNATFTDVAVSAELRVVEIAPDGLIGATCHTSNDFDQYVFVMAFDGAYSVQAIVGGEFFELLPWSAGSGLLVEPDATNFMQVTCAADRLTWILNGATLFDDTVDALDSGRVGFIAYTYDFGDLEIALDNVRLIDLSE